MNHSGLVGAITDWFKQPFNSQGSAFNWILFVGLLIIAAFLWNSVLVTIKSTV